MEPPLPKTSLALALCPVTQTIAVCAGDVRGLEWLRKNQSFYRVHGLDTASASDLPRDFTLFVHGVYNVADVVRYLIEPDFVSVVERAPVSPVRPADKPLDISERALLFFYILARGVPREGRFARDSMAETQIHTFAALAGLNVEDARTSVELLKDAGFLSRAKS